MTALLTSPESLHVQASGRDDLIPMPVEPHGMKLSYGQAAALISLPVCAVLGSAIGFAFAFVYIRRYRIAAVLLMLVAILGAAVIVPMWNQQVARYGSDPSEVVLFYPPLALCGLAAMASIGVAAIGLARRPDHDKETSTMTRGSNLRTASTAVTNQVNAPSR